jgi:hypothetical protein
MVETRCVAQTSNVQCQGGETQGLKLDKENETVYRVAVAAIFIKFRDAALHQIPTVPSLFAIEESQYHIVLVSWWPK